MFVFPFNYTCNIFLTMCTQLDLHKSIAFNGDTKYLSYCWRSVRSSLYSCDLADVLQMLTSLVIFYLPFYTYTCSKQVTEKYPVINKWMFKVINILWIYLVTKIIRQRGKKTMPVHELFNHKVGRKLLLNNFK